MKILIFGLPGSGKTTLAKALAAILGATHFNADDVRRANNDWDFSKEGRIRQAKRLGRLCDNAKTKYAIADFVCPTRETRAAFGDAFTIWVDRIDESRWDDTNKMFEPPTVVDVVIPFGLTVAQEASIVINELKKR